jgi:hypothetical protein
MSESNALLGVVVKEVATQDVVYQDCKVLHSDAIGLLIEVSRTVSEGGQIETVMSQILLPWRSVKHVIVMEERA